MIESCKGQAENAIFNQTTEAKLIHTISTQHLPVISQILKFLSPLTYTHFNIYVQIKRQLKLTKNYQYSSFPFF